MAGVKVDIYRHMPGVLMQQKGQTGGLVVVVVVFVVVVVAAKRAERDPPDSVVVLGAPAMETVAAEEVQEGWGNLSL
jgi:hypothetical protein